MDDNEVLIAVMGQTGSGKSTFVNLASGSKFPVGHGLASCTAQVRTTEPFQLAGRSVILIDTPGFDDSEISDVEVLKRISGFLELTYKNGKRLSGLIYMHPITDTRIGRRSRYNLQMFKKLCGDETLGNVVVVTTMWSSVGEDAGISRLQQLRDEDQFEFNSVEARGGRILRYGNNKEAALAILQAMLPNARLPLQIQRELVVERKTISETGAGKELGNGLQELEDKYKDQLQELRTEMEAALSAKDLQMQQAVKAERIRLEDLLAALTEDKRRLEAEYKRELAEAQNQLQNLRAQIKLEQKTVAEQVAAMRAEMEEIKITHGEGMEKLKRELNKLEGKEGLFGKFKKRFARASK
ncbi:hypothetical protein PHLGIDRAFT_129625 [Phlebiopsis gigantea 11061_1 CR5-6]|uniref:AIG1-type G domain-containing protein n=1 Tax=Phlebiopsis gigantea (strain 11061_1 CR5-6) TaxID=745531 RepID=A0A0C3PFF8_PHLG1|nr:hypothetical protein PHLGIDRAFT_129625 [Phlebiopsis gigantea 11061_1 CR5-6]